MANLTKQNRVHVGQDEAFEARWWRITQTIWAFLSFLMIAGFIGFFGRGPLAISVASGSNLTVRHERVLRFKTPSRIRLHAVGNAGNTEIAVRGDCFEMLGAAQITPQSSSSQPLDRGAIYKYPAAGSGSGLDL